MPTARVDDINMYYELQGSGEPLVLIGGLANDLSESEEIVHWLATRYAVLAFDNRGAGRTDKPDIPYSIEMMANDSAGLMQAVGVQRAHVLGISMGGRITLDLALRCPELVNRLVLVSTSARTARRRWWLPLFGIVYLAPILRGKYPQLHYAHVRQRRASSSFNCTDRLHELRVPTVIMHGRRDKVVPYCLAEELRTGIDGSELITFEGGHLFFYMRERQQFLEAVAAFLSS